MPAADNLTHKCSERASDGPAPAGWSVVGDALSGVALHHVAVRCAASYSLPLTRDDDAPSIT